MDDLRLDGNAAAGVLGQVFALEVTAAGSACAGCGTRTQLGAAHAYVHAPGIVLRCPGCGGVLVRIVCSGDRAWLDLTGVRYLELRL